jgi:endonuclease/exonuclease/phosphatase family metal-dependent hydrolase
MHLSLFWGPQTFIGRFLRLRAGANPLIAILIAMQGIVGSTLYGAESSSIQVFRVLTYNIHHAEGLDGKVDLARIAKLIKEQRADIVGLQEVDKGTTRTQKRDLPAELAALTGMACVFSNNFSFQGGEYGNAILTRFPVTSATNHHYRMLRPGEQRGLLQVVLDLHGRKFLFANTHIDYRPDDAERLSNVEEIRGILGLAGSMPLILCGDFNDVPASRTYAKLADFLEDSWTRAGVGEGLTIPAETPRKRIDFIWTRKGSSLKVRSINVLNSNASDHLPVIAEFQLE